MLFACAHKNTIGRGEELGRKEFQRQVRAVGVTKQRVTTGAVVRTYTRAECRGRAPCAPQGFTPNLPDCFDATSLEQR